MKKYIITFSILIFFCAAILAGGYYFHSNYYVIHDVIYPRDQQSLDLKGQDLPNFEDFTEFWDLRSLDLRQTGLTIEQYEELTQLLPNCDIQWLVPFQEDYLPLDTQELTLSEISLDDVLALEHLPQLKHVTLIDCADDDILEALATAVPNCDILPQYTIGSTILDETTRTYKSASITNIIRVLELFPNITMVDALECPNYTTLAKLQQQYPGCNIIYRVPVGDEMMSQYETEIHLESLEGVSLELALGALPWIKTVTIDQPVPDPDLILRLRQEYPDIQFTYCFDLYGKIVTPETQTINLNRIQLESAEKIDKLLAHFNNLTRAEMRRCGLTNEEMEMLKEHYPDTFFVWEVQIGHAWIRTDVKYFMPYQHRLVLYDEHVDNLKYLTELICLDMGHMKVTRTDYLAYMPKLQYLLMCSTPITDISYCANMKDLKYLELFLTKVTDFSPLLECKNLVDLNICYTNPEDPLIFGQMTQLKNLWFRNMYDWQVRSQLRQMLPNTTMVFDGGSSTGGGWRKLDNYYAQRDILGMPYMEED